MYKNIPNLDEKFNATVELVRALPKVGGIAPELDLKLKMYALYKVATIGKNETPKPSIFKIESRLKWETWKRFENNHPDEAKYKYMHLFGEKIKSVFYSGNSKTLLENNDMTFLNNISRKALEVLFFGVLETDEAEDDIKEEMKRLRKIYLPDVE